MYDQDQFDHPEQPVVPAVPVEYAGFWVRVAATILDGFILGIPITIFVSFLFGWEWYTGGATSGRADFVNFLLSAWVTVAFWVHWGGKTPGKKIMGIRIVTYRDRQEFGYGKALLRCLLGYTVSALLLGLGFVLVAFHKEKRGLHDLIAGTCVVYDRR
jgi:uncharacterized RDD family membrane protein YckC